MRTAQMIHRGKKLSRTGSLFSICIEDVTALTGCLGEYVARRVLSGMAAVLVSTNVCISLSGINQALSLSLASTRVSLGGNSCVFLAVALTDVSHRMRLQRSGISRNVLNNSPRVLIRQQSTRKPSLV